MSINETHIADPLPEGVTVLPIPVPIGWECIRSRSGPELVFRQGALVMTLVLDEGRWLAAVTRTVTEGTVMVYEQCGRGETLVFLAATQLDDWDEVIVGGERWYTPRVKTQYRDGALVVFAHEPVTKAGSRVGKTPAPGGPPMRQFRLGAGRGDPWGPK